MNIFSLYNSLWGVARMGVNKEILGSSGNKEILGGSGNKEILGGSGNKEIIGGSGVKAIPVVETIIQQLHTFLPTHYGDLLWLLLLLL